MTNQRADHVLVVTSACSADCHADCDDCGHDYEVICPGIEAGKCITTWECSDCTPEDKERLEDEGYEPGMAHGVEHFSCPGIGWGPQSGCFVTTNDDLYSACGDLEPIALGTHAIDWESGDPGELYLQLITTSSVPSAS